MTKTTVYGAKERIGKNQAALAAGTLHDVILDKALEKAHAKKRINPEKKEALLGVLKTKVDSYGIELHSFDEERLSQTVNHIAENLTKTPGQSSHEAFSAERAKGISLLVAQGNAKGKKNMDTLEAKAFDAVRLEYSLLSGMNSLEKELADAAKAANLDGEPVLSSRRGRILPVRRHIHTEAGDSAQLDKKVDLAFYEATFRITKEQEVTLEEKLLAAQEQKNNRDLAELNIDKSHNSAISLALRTRHNPSQTPESGLPSGERKEGEIQQYESLLVRTFPEMKEKIAKDKHLKEEEEEEEEEVDRHLLEAKVERLEKGVWGQYETKYPEEARALSEDIRAEAPPLERSQEAKQQEIVQKEMPVSKSLPEKRHEDVNPLSQKQARSLADDVLGTMVDQAGLTDSDVGKAFIDLKKGKKGTDLNHTMLTATREALIESFTENPPAFTDEESRAQYVSELAACLREPTGQHSYNNSANDTVKVDSLMLFQMRHSPGDPGMARLINAETERMWHIDHTEGQTVKAIVHKDQSIEEPTEFKTALHAKVALARVETAIIRGDEFPLNTEVAITQNVEKYATFYKDGRKLSPKEAEEYIKDREKLSPKEAEGYLKEWQETIKERPVRGADIIQDMTMKDITLAVIARMSHEGRKGEDWRENITRDDMKNALNVKMQAAEKGASLQHGEDGEKAPDHFRRQVDKRREEKGKEKEL